MNKTIIFQFKKKILLMLLILFFCPAFVLAAEDVIVSYQGVPGPLFNVINMSPGDVVSRTITVINNTNDTQKFKIQANTIIASSPLAEKINIAISDELTGEEKYKGTFADFFKAGEIFLGPLQPAIPVSYKIITSIDRATDNDYMGLIESFNLKIGFSAETADVNLLDSLSNALGFTEGGTNVVVEYQDTNDFVPEVKGSSETDVVNKSGCTWWWVISIFLTITLILNTILLKRYRAYKFGKIFWVSPLLLGAVSYFSHNFYCENSSQVYPCNYFLLIIVAISLIFYLYNLLTPRS